MARTRVGRPGRIAPNTWRTCGVCGVEFLANSGPHKYCSPRCAERAARHPRGNTALSEAARQRWQRPGFRERVSAAIRRWHAEHHEEFLVAVAGSKATRRARVVERRAAREQERARQRAERDAARQARDQRIVALWQAGYSGTGIAALVGVTRTTVTRALRAAGVPTLKVQLGDRADLARRCRDCGGPVVRARRCRRCYIRRRYRERPDVREKQLALQAAWRQRQKEKVYA